MSNLRPLSPKSPKSLKLLSDLNVVAVPVAFDTLVGAQAPATATVAAATAPPVINGDRVHAFLRRYSLDDAFAMKAQRLMALGLSESEVLQRIRSSPNTV